MKVTSVDTLIVNARLRNWVFVKITTDQPELVGWVEATLEWKARAVACAVADLASLVLGQDPRRAEYLWQARHRDQFFQGGPVSMSALSRIDQALWDINAQWLDVPAYQFFGGALRDRLRLYDHLGGGDSCVVCGVASTLGFAEAARRAVKDGFTALKILALPSGPALPRGGDIAEAIALMAAVREAVGDEVDIVVDIHGRNSAAVQYGHALALYTPWFFEEPCQPGNPAVLARVARASPFPITTGERLISLQEFRDNLAIGACAVLQPDVCHVGGPTRAAQDRGTRRKPPHTSGLAQPAGTDRHCGRPTSQLRTTLRARARSHARRCALARRGRTWHSADSHGQVEFPAGPGWGITFNEEAARRHPYTPEPQLATRNRDGSVSDS